MSYAISCKGQGRCDCCPGNDNPQLCDDLALRRLKEVCVGFDTTADGTAFPYPYSCLYYGSSACAMACLDRGAQLPIPLLFTFLTTTEQGFPWWDEEAHAGCFVAKLSLEGIQQLRGRIPVDYNFTLAAMPTYPIVRARLRFWSATGPLVMAALFDIGAQEHGRVLLHLSAQHAFHVHLHRNDTLAYIYSKLCPLKPSLQEDLDAIVAEAKRRLAAIPEDDRNFQRAKHAFHTVMGM